MDILISAQYSQFSVEEDRIAERLVACEVNCQLQNTLSFSPLREFNIMIGVGATPYRAQSFSPFLDVEAGVAVTNSSRRGQLRYTDEGLPRAFDANEIILDEDAGTLVGVATEVEAGVQVRFLPQTVARVGVSHSLLRAYGNTMQTYGLALTLMQSFE